MAIFSKIKKFFEEVRAELDKVKFPDRPETIKKTAVVLAVSAALGVYIGGIDFGLTKVIEAFIR